MGLCLGNRVGTHLADDIAEALSPCAVDPWRAIPGSIFYVLGSSRVESAGKVLSVTDETGGDDLEQATPASRFDAGSSPDTFRSTSNTTWHLQRTARAPNPIYGNGCYSMAVRAIVHTTSTRNIMGVKSDSVAQYAAMTHAAAVLRHTRLGSSGNTTDWSVGLSPDVVDAAFHTLGFSFTGWVCKFYVDGAYVGEDEQTPEPITSIASPLDQIGYIVTGTQLTYGVSSLWSGVLNARDHAAIHAHAAALYP